MIVSFWNDFMENSQEVHKVELLRIISANDFPLSLSRCIRFLKRVIETVNFFSHKK